MRIARERGFTGFNVYPYLTSYEARARHRLAASILKSANAQRILDYGAYSSPIYRFLEYCPEIVVSIEPLGELVTNTTLPYMSKMVPCAEEGKTMHVVNVPSTAADFADSSYGGIAFDAVLCIGCDSAYGPKPYHLIEPLVSESESGVLLVEAGKKFYQPFLSAPEAHVCGGCQKVMEKDYELTNVPAMLGPDVPLRRYVHMQCTSLNIASCRSANHRQKTKQKRLT